MKVAIQGELGSFHHEAATKWYNDTVEIISATTFADVFSSLKSKQADAAIVAVENSLYGSISEVLDLLEKNSTPIVGEIFLRIEQQLITLPGVELSKITRVYSHPVALAQCDHFLSEKLPNAERIEHHDTAASVAFIKKLGDPSAAAIAGRSAAKLYNLPTLSESIEDDRANFTRFLVLDPTHAVENPNKFSLILTTNHAPGALAKCLEIFATNNANLTKLQSRPIVGQPWKYKFYVDVEATPSQFKEAIKKIKEDGAQITVLGAYKAATV